jgi:chromosome segregation ATPase
MEGHDLADLYFRRWPVQENAFKDAVVLGLNEHRGNCGRVVTNIVVVSELERLESRAKRDADALNKLTDAATGLAEEASKRARDVQRAESALATRRRRFDEAIAEGKTSGKAFTRIALDHQRALVDAETCTKAANKAQAALDKNVSQRAIIERRAEDIAADKKRLEPQRTIRQLDVTQDTILTAAKLTAAQLISFVLREYLPSTPMTPQTFVQRVLCVRGRKEIARDHELVVFYENPRDPLINDALRNACERLNRRALRRDDRRLRFAVEPLPAKHGRSD